MHVSNFFLNYIPKLFLFNNYVIFYKKYYQLACQKFGAAYPSQKPRSSTGCIGLFDIHVDLVWDKDMDVATEDMQEHLPQVLEGQRF
jgi:hypothetical protein